MKTTLITAAVLAGLLTVGAQAASALPAACQKAGMDMAMAPTAEHDMAAMGTEAHQREAMAGMKQMDADMMIGMSAKDPDIAFVCGMIAHHQGAISMSEVELKHGKDSWAKQMAEKIIAAQKAEIADMTRWIETNGAR